MGMRRNIELKFPMDEGKTQSIYLYTHWGAEGLEHLLAKALDQDRGRWNDPSYLARYIVSQVVDSHDDTTGHGLAPYEVDPEFPTLVVNLKEKTVNEIPYEQFIKEPEQLDCWRMLNEGQDTALCEGCGEPLLDGQAIIKGGSRHASCA